MKKLLRDILRSSFLQRAVGVLAAEYLRLVWKTNRFSREPQNIYDLVEPSMPAILVFWHGQHFMTPFIKTKPEYRAKVLISRHRDGEFNALAVERLGIGTIRGSGDHGSAFHRKGGVGAFKEMVRALDEGYNVALTADVPKRARVAGLGVIMLARESGRPIMPFAMATSRFIRLKNWDRTTINLPFGRGTLVGIKEIHVPPDADAATMERLRQDVEDTLNEANRIAYAMVGRPEAGGAAAHQQPRQVARQEAHHG
ncbi:lysophospholipid acyltransferase family protein [Bradyrhizobium sp.]|uniref:lysophospholipid acyltransferase family protein n=1 Tax=Bradyrhizobium sp. TaxID=376 RepID=UPI002B65A8B2|nr:lysophospholipid acyltransferase family protein [Bradyrhizobium sp.]HWX64462.1 lysophospholipid acyltransferase family protein [Bradyrhizobium sp.]